MKAFFELELVGDPDDGMISVDTGCINGYSEGVVAVIAEKLRVNVQMCGSGHKYFADSHEYPCPYCSVKKLEDKIKALKAGK